MWQHLYTGSNPIGREPVRKFCRDAEYKSGLIWILREKLMTLDAVVTHVTLAYIMNEIQTVHSKLYTTNIRQSIISPKGPMNICSQVINHLQCYGLTRMRVIIHINNCIISFVVYVLLGFPTVADGILGAEKAKHLYLSYFKFTFTQFLLKIITHTCLQTYILTAVYPSTIIVTHNRPKHRRLFLHMYLQL